jgi:ABC-type branched-subunit amino acid transport system ATPase component
VHFTDAAFSWGYVHDKEASAPSANTKKLVEVEHSDSAVIKGINFKLNHTDLLVVAGRIGSGKTTLLHSVMQETELKTGSI